MVLAEKARADTCVIDGDKPVVLVGLLGVLAVVEVAEVELLTLEEDHCQSVKGQCTADIIVQHPCAQVEPLVVLASLCELTLFLRELSHLEVYMGLFHEVTLLDASLGFHDEILGRLSDLVLHRAWPCAQRNSRRVMIRRMVAQTDVAKRVLHDRFEDVGRLHTDLLREATLACPACSAHVEFVDDHLKQVELLVPKIAQQLLICVVLCVQLRVCIRALRVVLVFIDLVKEAVASILELDDLLWLQALHVVFVVGLLLRMVALVEHVGVVDALPAAQHLNLVQLLLLHIGGTVTLTK